MLAEKSTDAKPTHKRFVIIALLCLITCLNYLDRANLAVAGTYLQRDLQLNAEMMGIVFSAFGWSYTFMQIPNGWLIERFSPYLLYGAAIIGWSLFNGLIGVAGSLTMLVGFRLALGFFEAPAFPVNARIVAEWFPKKERGRAIGCYTAAEYIGLAFFTPVLAWIISMFSWREVFFATGFLGILVAVIWFAKYKSPEQYPGISQAELRYIHDEKQEISAKRKISFREFKYFLSQRQLIGLYIGHFAVTSTLFFFMTWFPSYLVVERGLKILQAGFFTSLPFIAAIVGVFVGGNFSDMLIRKGYSLNVARKWPVIAGLVLSADIVLANYVDSIALVVLIMSLAFAGQGIASTVAWALLSDIAPQNSVGIVGSIFNFCANLGGTISPLAVGIIISRTGSFEIALLFITIVALVGAASYIFIIGKPSRIPIYEEEQL